jgi:hypothetical protein
MLPPGVSTKCRSMPEGRGWRGAVGRRQRSHLKVKVSKRDIFTGSIINVDGVLFLWCMRLVDLKVKVQSAGGRGGGIAAVEVSL